MPCHLPLSLTASFILPPTRHSPKFALQPPLIPNPPPPKITHLSSSLLGHLNENIIIGRLGNLDSPVRHGCQPLKIYPMANSTLQPLFFSPVFSCPFSDLAIGQSSGSLPAMATRSSSCTTPTGELTSNLAAGELSPVKAGELWL
nr:unnamed protein product [Digitaria exilis]